MLNTDLTDYADFADFNSFNLQKSKKIRAICVIRLIRVLTFDNLHLLITQSIQPRYYIILGYGRRASFRFSTRFSTVDIACPTSIE